MSRPAGPRPSLLFKQFASWQRSHGRRGTPFAFAGQNALTPGERQRLNLCICKYRCTCLRARRLSVLLLSFRMVCEVKTMVNTVAVMCCSSVSMLLCYLFVGASCALSCKIRLLHVAYSCRLCFSRRLSVIHPMLQDLQQSVSAFVGFVRDQPRNCHDRSPHTLQVAIQNGPLPLNVEPLPIISSTGRKQMTFTGKGR